MSRVIKKKKWILVYEFVRVFIVDISSYSLISCPYSHQLEQNPMSEKFNVQPNEKSGRRGRKRKKKMKEKKNNHSQKAILLLLYLINKNNSTSLAMPSTTNEYAKAERELANEQQLQEKS